MNFLIDLASHPSFQSGAVHTGFIDEHFSTLFPPLQTSDQLIAQAVAAQITNELNSVKLNAAMQGVRNKPFSECDSFRVNSTAVRTMQLKLHGNTHKIQLKQREMKINDSDWQSFDIYPVAEPENNRFTLKLNLNGVQSTFSAVISSESIDVFNEVNLIDFAVCMNISCSFSLFLLFWMIRMVRLSSRLFNQSS